MHYDNIAWADELKRWRQDPANKKFSVSGDDRSPAFSWLGSMYSDGERLVVPADNLMRALMEGGASVPVPGGKNGKTFKAQTQSGMLVQEESWPLTVDGSAIPVAPLLALKSEPDFEKHTAAAVANRFTLFVKRAKIGTSKHVRVRPRFDRWAASGTIGVWDEQITEKVLRDILAYAGSYKGLGDWRPSSKTPGPFGRFDSTVEEI
jgi:hypothetical protein